MKLFANNQLTYSDARDVLDKCVSPCDGKKENKNLAHTSLLGEWRSTTILNAFGNIKPLDCFQLYAKSLNLPFIGLMKIEIDPNLLLDKDRKSYLDYHFLPFRRDSHGMLHIATSNPSNALKDFLLMRYGNEFKIYITSNYDLLWKAKELFSKQDDLDARERLHIENPELSAKTVLSGSQKKWLAIGAVFFLASLLIWPIKAVVFVNLMVHFLYLFTFIVKAGLFSIGGRAPADSLVGQNELNHLKDYELPVYTILVPMYKEKEVLPFLVESINALDYPRSKLDVKLILEDDDVETIGCAKGMRLPGNFQIIRVPVSNPRTKPKACNYALRFAYGDLITIYDAEDRPEVDQLKKVVAAFKKLPRNVGCIQARLNYYNRNENLLTRLFTLEYTQWFDFLIPALDRLGIPIPLGGTSNHFRLDVLKKVGYWDPYNTTEDADLGIRLCQLGYKVAVINSTTFEEANMELGNWIRQRTRWVKGYMQTWLVHMRHPFRLLKSSGFTGFVGFQMFVGGPVFIKLMNPILFSILFISVYFDPHWMRKIFTHEIVMLSSFSLITGNLALIYFACISGLKRRYYSLIAYGLLFPFYWFLQSVAAYRALVHLVFKPHLWEKTAHGLSNVFRKTPRLNLSQNNNLAS